MQTVDEKSLTIDPKTLIDHGAELLPGNDLWIGRALELWAATVQASCYEAQHQGVDVCAGLLVRMLSLSELEAVYSHAKKHQEQTGHWPQELEAVRTYLDHTLSPYRKDEHSVFTQHGFRLGQLTPVIHRLRDYGLIA